MESLNKILNYFDYNSKVILTFFFICLLFRVLDKIFHVNKIMSAKRGHILNPFTYIRFITRIFVHRDWVHFSNNFFYILLLGPMIEEKYGSLNLIYMILITAFASSLIQVILERSESVGCSDIVYMMIVLCSFVSITTGKIPITFVIIFFKFIADEIILTFHHKKNDNVGHISHVMGAICGFIFAYFVF